MKHSKLPWKYEQETGIVLDQENNQIMAINPFNRKPNTVFISKACNNYYKTLEALKTLHNWLVCSVIATPEDMAQSFSDMEETASKAIKETEE